MAHMSRLLKIVINLRPLKSYFSSAYINNLNVAIATAVAGTTRQSKSMLLSDPKPKPFLSVLSLQRMSNVLAGSARALAVLILAVLLIFVSTCESQRVVILVSMSSCFSFKVFTKIHSERINLLGILVCLGPVVQAPSMLREVSTFRCFLRSLIPNPSFHRIMH